MAKIKFFTDSASDIPQEYLDKYPNLEMISFPINTEEEELLDRVSMTPEDFYTFLDEQKKLPTHAQITPFQFGELFFKTWKEGYTHLIYTAINSHGSATYQNALQQASSFFFENPSAKGQIEIEIIDSESYTLAYGYPVIQGAEMAEKGTSPEEIIAFIRDWVENAKILFVPFNLKYAKKSGRVSAASAFVGEALGMKPIMTFKHGDSVLIAKVRGEKNVVSALIEVVDEDRQAGAPYCLLSTTLDVFDERLQEECTEEYGYPPSLSTKIGGVISINAGTAVLGIVYRKVNEESPVENWAWNYSEYKKALKAKA
ncbi:MAG: DegV family protein [Eubacteriales bacterium]